MGKSVERIPYLSPLVEGFFRVYLKQGHLAHIKDTIIETISSQLNPKAAQLYLCSQKDTLVPFQETRQHALSQAQLLKSLNTTPHIDRVSLLSPNSQSVSLEFHLLVSFSSSFLTYVDIFYLFSQSGFRKS